jgi:hypothetical protein
MSTGVALCQFLQQRLRLLQVSRIKSFGEPVIHGSEEVIGFLAFALLLPEASQARGRTEFPGFRLLALGYADGVMEASFCFRLMIRILL